MFYLSFKLLHLVPVRAYGDLHTHPWVRALPTHRVVML